MMRNKKRVFREMLICIGFMVWLACPVSGSAEPGSDDPWTFTAGETWRLSVAPAEDLYRPYLANLLRPTMSMTYMHLTDPDIPDAGNDRFAFMLGGQAGVLRAYSVTKPDTAFQVDIYGAFYGQFDIDSATDNLGWDGFYGLILSWANGSGLAARMAWNHDSSHLGDEYIEETGRLRINYTRQEIAAGLSYRFEEGLRFYGEAGYDYDIQNNGYQEPWRIQGGAEYEVENRWREGRLGYFAALDIAATEDLDWDVDVTAHIGLTAPLTHALQAARVGLVYRNGRSLIGELHMHREEWWGVRFSMDL